MASEEMRKKWGTIFMGEREASVEQLNAMREPQRKEKERKEQVEDYMERVRARAADRAREILGAAYAERQKVLDEAKNLALAQKQQAADECARLKAEAEKARQQAADELARAAAEREEAEKIRLAAHDEGFQAGMNKADIELHEFRVELGQSLSQLLRAIERQRKNILTDWREQLVELTQCAAQAGTGFVLRKEHEAILRALVFQALDLLESRGSVTLRVNPRDEDQVNDMFRAARERFPELRQWIVTGDSHIEEGGLVAESGTGSVDLRRENFREMVDGILEHLALPENASENAAEKAVRDIIEKEVAHIASLTPEIDQPTALEQPAPQAAPSPVATPEEPAETPQPAPEAVNEEPEAAVDSQPEAAAEEPVAEPEAAPVDDELSRLEEELFPIDEDVEIAENRDAAPEAEKAAPPDPRALSEGGFV